MKHPRRVIRESFGATLKEMASMVGTHPVKIFRWEMGQSIPSVEENHRWAKALRELESDALKRIQSAKVML